MSVASTVDWEPVNEGLARATDMNIRQASFHFTMETSFVVLPLLTEMLPSVSMTKVWGAALSDASGNSSCISIYNVLVVPYLKLICWADMCVQRSQFGEHVVPTSCLVHTGVGLVLVFAACFI